MKASYLQTTGEPDVLIYGDLPDPTAGPGQLLIGVRAISLNHVETVWRSGIRPYFKITPPHILGAEVAGEVLAVGAGVTNFSPGDRVVAQSSTGSYCELAVAPAATTHKLPDNVPYEEAAALSSTGPTAYRCVVRRAQVRPGHTVLVTAAASGTGMFIVQIARAAGARVIATAGSDEKRRLVEQVGADATIDHYNEDVAKRIAELTDGEGIDSAIDAVSSQTMYDAMLNSLKARGRLVTYGNIAGTEVSVNIRTLFSKGLDLLGGQGTDLVHGAAERYDDSKNVVAMAGQGLIRTVIGKQLPLSQAAEAHRLLDENAVAGKIILTP